MVIVWLVQPMAPHMRILVQKFVMRRFMLVYAFAFVSDRVQLNFVDTLEIISLVI